jgi:hypothetical protein
LEGILKGDPNLPIKEYVLRVGAVNRTTSSTYIGKEKASKTSSMSLMLLCFGLVDGRRDLYDDGVEQVFVLFLARTTKYDNYLLQNDKSRVRIEMRITNGGALYET